MLEQELVEPRKKTRFMTQGSNTPEEQLQFGKTTLVDTDNLQIRPNDSTLGNTKVYLPENPEETGQESVKKCKYQSLTSKG